MVVFLLAIPVASANNNAVYVGQNTTVDGQGNPYSGENITFNINGIFYTRLTNEVGVAHLNINLGPGEYIVTSSYNSNNIANSIKVEEI